MNRQSSQPGPFSTPAAILAVAVIMPAAMLTEAAGYASGASASIITAATPDQLESVARCVTEAARRFQTSQAPLCFEMLDSAACPAEPCGVAALPDATTIHPSPLLASLIDLPPPSLHEIL